MPSFVPEKRTKIVCVGDSITQGYRFYDTNLSYPSVLSDRLDPKRYEIVNLGLSRRTMTKTGDYPYWNEDKFIEALQSNADIIVLMLGTNDSKSYNWNEDSFKTDYLSMIAAFQNMPSSP